MKYRIQGDEGVVFVKYDVEFQGRISFKAISNKLLIKNRE